MSTPPRYRVLVIDDEADIRTVVGLNLGLAGLDFGEASDGEEGLRILEDSRWDACILDLMMPGTDGLQVLHRMTTSTKNSLAIVVLSAKGSPASAIEALKLGAHAHLTKPFSPGAVAQVVEELISIPAEEREARRLDAIARAGQLQRLGIPTV